jgi:hypothetical protein
MGLAFHTDYKRRDRCTRLSLPVDLRKVSAIILRMGQIIAPVCHSGVPGDEQLRPAGKGFGTDGSRGSGRGLHHWRFIDKGWADLDPFLPDRFAIYTLLMFSFLCGRDPETSSNDVNVAAVETFVAVVRRRTKCVVPHYIQSVNWNVSRLPRLNGATQRESGYAAIRADLIGASVSPRIRTTNKKLGSPSCQLIPLSR